MHLPLSLPIPADDAKAASHALQALIATEIAQHDGWIPFSRYMELALYAPNLGYYSGGAAKLGKDGDFTTAPEMTPLFGATLAQFAARCFTQTSPQIMEFGAGSGRLAYDILSECQQAGITVERYFIVELSGELRARQEDLLRAFPQVQWLQQMPAAFSGVVVGNEVLDAMPVQVLIKAADGWRECGVSVGDNGQLVWREQASSTAAAQDLAQQIPDAGELPLGYLTEVHPQAQAFMRSVAAMLKAGTGGAALFIDYGFPAHEYYLAQRGRGTLMCHYRHHSHDDPFYWPGLQDITAHVDFSAMANAAEDAGLDLLGYQSQAGFLLAAGITDILQRTSVTATLDYLPQSNALQKLVSPAEMGELFKVLLIGSQLSLPEHFARTDRSHRL